MDTSICPDDQGTDRPNTPDKLVRCSSTLDTSPIPSDPSPISTVSTVTISGSEIGNPVDIEPMEFAKTSSELDVTSKSGVHDLTSRSSKSSLSSVKLDDDLDMSDHDRAFINESLLAEIEQEERAERRSPDGRSVHDIGASPEFKKPDAPVDNVSVKSMQQAEQQQERVVSKPPIPSHPHRDNKTTTAAQEHAETYVTSATIQLNTRHGSVESVDSAIETDITKSESVDSLASCDSGLGLSHCQPPMRAPLPPAIHASLPPAMLAPQAAIRPKRLESFLREGHKPVIIRKQDASHTHEPNLQISSEMHQMLSRAGVAGGAQGGAPLQALEELEGGSQEEVRIM